MKNKFTAVKSYICLKPFLNGLSFFLGVLFLGLVSCSSATVSSPSSPTEDKTPPTVTISTNENLEKDKTGTITFTFSERVKGFTKSDIQFAMNGEGATPEKGEFVTNNEKSYSLEITPKLAGTLTVTIPDKSFEDLSGNQNTNTFSTNFLVEDKILPTLTSINTATLIEGESAYLSFIFSENVNNFTPDDIQFLSNKANGVNNVEKGRFVTNNLMSYSLRITPKEEGTLYVSIPANSFEDLSGNQNDKPYSNDFMVLSSNTVTYTISFKPLNGGSFISPQITNLKVVDNTAIEQTRLEEILSYPPTGPKPDIEAVTRGIFEWRTNGIKYELSNLVSSDLTLEAVWSNSCGKVETFHPTNTTQLRTYTDKAITANAATNLNHIDTSAITNMNQLFYVKDSFNGKIGCWNTAKVNNMATMFLGANAFNQDIGNWDVANVNNMEAMFVGANAFNQDIGSWDVGNVNNMRAMLGAAAFDQDISSWDVSKVNNMKNMFARAKAFNQDISSWNTANVTDMKWMFSDASAFNQDISSWDVGNVTTMNEMFSNASSFDQDLSKWPVNNVTKHTDMFTGSAMESKTSQHPRFSDKTPPTVTISTNESLAININGTITFTFSENVNNFTTNDIQFLPTGFSVEKGKFVTNNEKSYSLEITPKEEGTLYVSIPAKSFEDLSGNQNDKPYSIGFAIFPSGATTIHTISFKLNGGSFIFPQITNLKVVSNTAIEETRLGRILSYPPTGPKPDIEAVTRGIFEWRTNGTKYEVSTLVSSDLTLEAVWSNSCGKIETFHPANRGYLQNYIKRAITDNATTNLNHINTSAITDMNNLFYQKRSFKGEIGCWNTANVTNVYRIFKDAYAFNQNIGSWDVGNVTDMNGMFSSASVFNQDISRWNVAKVTRMSEMFFGASAFNQDIGSWDVANVTAMSLMFANAAAFNQDISKWNVGNVTDMGNMFTRAKAFNQDISSWDVSKVTTMNNMFYNANAFNQDISKWNVANVTDMRWMFSGTSAFNQDLSGWSVNNVTNHTDMFTGSAMATKTNQHPTFPSP